MAKKNKDLPVLPRIFHSCGKDDFLIDKARETRDFFMSLEGNPYHYVYEEHEGVHGWEYWDEHITDFLEFLQLDAPERASAIGDAEELSEKIKEMMKWKNAFN